ncbi:hypothetical protein PM8797T_03820 [Gimesia maris DSM 8797]|nr:hypothetical protein PM8797T_03820 [Gimesia maris DSM 8797]
MNSGGSGVKDCEVWRPAGIHSEQVLFCELLIWKKGAVL